MAHDKFLIAPLNSGLQTDLKPWLISDDAWAQLQNAYLFRGRVRKRFGSAQSANVLTGSRLGISLGNTSNMGAAAGTIGTGGIGGHVFAVGQQFLIGTVLYTVVTAGAVQDMIKTAATTTATFSTTDGAYNFVGAPISSAITFYPATPVMGLTQYAVNGVNNHPTFAFDTQFAYQFTGAAWIRFISTPNPVWHGTDSQFFWSANWQGFGPGEINLFTTNFNAVIGTGTLSDDPIWTYDGTNWTPFSYSPVAAINTTNSQPITVTQTITQPPASSANPFIVQNYVQSALIIVAYKNRLVLLNTIENNAFGSTVFDTGHPTTTGITPTNYQTSTNTAFPWRARYSQYGSPFGVNAWLEENQTYYPNAILVGTTNGSGNLTATVSQPPFIPGTFDQHFVCGSEIMTVTALGTPNVMATTGTSSTHTFNTTTGQLILAGATINTPVYFSQTPFTGEGGGYVDAATDEAIISAEFIKDRLIVYFERSTWELVYSGNEVQPFNWQKINTELGSESTFSIVPFDKIVLGVGETGIHACSGPNVERIDNKIPDLVFQARYANSGDARVHGIRDYDVEQVYWTFPVLTNTEANINDVYPNQVLVYNYKTGSWALNDDCFTCFGYFEQETGLSWANQTESWLNANFSWDSGTTQSNHRLIVAGNQQGFISLLSPDISTNAPALYITDMTAVNDPVLTIINHTLLTGQYVLVQNALGITSYNNQIFQVTAMTANTISLDAPAGTGTYTGGGTVTRVSQIQMKSKQWNPYIDQSSDVFLSKIDFGVQKTSQGQVTVDYFSSSTEVSLVQAGLQNGSIMGNNILETSPYAVVPYEASQTRLWHQIYFQGDGECVQLYISLSDDQMRNLEIVESDFQLEGLILHTQKSSRLR